MRAHRRIVTERDVRLFRYLFQNKIACSLQIKRDVFHTADKSSCWRRLRQLVKTGYIKKLTAPGLNLPVFLNDKPATSILTDEGYIPSRCEPGRVELAKLDHDLTLIDICSRIRKFSSFVAIAYEQELRMKTAHESLFEQLQELSRIPDALFITSEGEEGKAYAVEYQKKFNDPGRWQEKLRQFYRCRFIDQVLVLTKTDSSIKRLAALDRTIGTDGTSKLYYTTLERFFAVGRVVHFKSANEDILEFNFATNGVTTSLPTSLPTALTTKWAGRWAPENHKNRNKIRNFSKINPNATPQLGV